MKIKLPKAILLDLDDTIIANEVMKKECWKIVGDEFSSVLENVEPEKLISVILTKSTIFWSDPVRHKEWRQKLDEARREVVKMAFRDLGMDDSYLSDRIADRFSEVRDEAMHPFPGAIETVEKLNQLGVELVLVTNGSSIAQRKKIERFSLEPLFEHILIEGEQGVGKPEEGIYRIALQKIGFRPDETWMIGDNIIWDVLAPQKLGINGIWIDNKDDKPATISGDRPFLSISTLKEIMDFVY